MKTYTLASSRPRSLTGVPDLGDMICDGGSSAWPRILPGHQEPFLLQLSPHCQGWVEDVISISEQTRVISKP